MAHTKADYTLADAIAGGKLVYTKLTGGAVANDVLYYGAVDVLGYAGGYIPSSAPPVVMGINDAEAKSQLTAALAPCCDAAGVAAASFDWAKIATLIVKLLPIILSLV